MKSAWFNYHDVYADQPDGSIPYTAAMYHLPVKRFREQLDIISQSGKDVITVSDYITGKYKNDTIVLTFDDGWRGVLEYAIEPLRQHEFNATLFVTRDFIGKPGFLERAQLEYLIAQGIDIGIHGTTHKMLSSCSFEEITWEFEACKDYLETLANRPVEIAALPGGDYNETVLGAVKKAGIRVLCSSIPGINSENTDSLLLKRLAIRNTTTTADVQRYCSYRVAPEILRWAFLEVGHRALGGKNYALFRRWIFKYLKRGTDAEIFEP